MCSGAGKPDHQQSVKSPSVCCALRSKRRDVRDVWLMPRQRFARLHNCVAFRKGPLFVCLAAGKKWRWRRQLGLDFLMNVRQVLPKAVIKPSPKAVCSACEIPPWFSTTSRCKAAASDTSLTSPAEILKRGKKHQCIQTQGQKKQTTLKAIRN